MIINGINQSYIILINKNLNINNLKLAISEKSNIPYKSFKIKIKGKYAYGN